MTEDDPACPEYTETFSAEVAIVFAKGVDFLRAFTWGNLVDVVLKPKREATRGVCIGFPLAETDAFLFCKVVSSPDTVQPADITFAKFVNSTPVFTVIDGQPGLRPSYAPFSREDCTRLCNLKLLPPAKEVLSVDESDAMEIGTVFLISL